MPKLSSFCFLIQCILKIYSTSLFYFCYNFANKKKIAKFLNFNQILAETEKTFTKLQQNNSSTLMIY